MFVFPAGHLAEKKGKQGKKDAGANRTMACFFDVEKCKTCILRNGCYEEGSKTKTYSVSIKSDQHKEQMAFQETQNTSKKRQNTDTK